MNPITRNSKHGKHRVHVANANHAPLCGGGNSSRSAEWQEVIIEPNCQRCAAILQRRRDAAQSTAVNAQNEIINHA